MCATLPHLKHFHFLQTLMLPSSWIHLDLLKNLEGLPRLRFMNLSDARSAHEIFGSLFQWEARTVRSTERMDCQSFTALECLIIAETDDLLVQILEAHSPLNHTLSALAIEVLGEGEEPQTCLKKCSERIPNHFPGLQFFAVNTLSGSSSRMTWDILQSLSTCSNSWANVSESHVGGRSSFRGGEQLIIVTAKKSICNRKS